MSIIYYVYELWNPLTNKPFYVGKSYNRTGYSRYSSHISESNYKRNHKTNTIRKIINSGNVVGFTIVFETDNEQLAFNKEIELIKLYGRRNIKTGILTNLTDGGEGASGYKITEHGREKRRLLSKGKNNAMYGKTHTVKSKKQISENRIEKIKNNIIIPTKHSEEHKQKLRDDNKGGKATAKSIYQICPNTGIVLHQFNSIRQAAISVNGLRANICSSLTTYKHRRSYGFYWRFVNDPDIVNHTLMNFNELKLNQNRRLHIYVDQFDLFGNFIKSWNTVSEAAKYYNFDLSSICKAIKNNTPYKEFKWIKSQ